MNPIRKRLRDQFLNQRINKRVSVLLGDPTVAAQCARKSHRSQCRLSRRGSFGAVFGGLLKQVFGHTRWGPLALSWFITPMNTIVLYTINHSYGSYKTT